jgi:type II secretory pathway component PulM
MEVKIMNIGRSVARDAIAMSKGIEYVKEEISFWEPLSRKTKSVKKRLERLYAVQTQLVEKPKESLDLIKQLKEINKK